MHKITRRRFLQQAAVTAAGLGLAAPKISVLAETDPLPDVVVARGTNDDPPEALLKTALEGLGGIGRFVQPGQVVAIKPNATWAFRPHTSSASDPDLLRALIGLVQGAGAKRILVVDHCSIDPGTAEALRINGIGKVIEETGVEMVVPDRFNAARDVYTRIEIPAGKDFSKLGVIKAAVEADVRINLALAKSHNVTRMSMCMKHMMGLLEVPQNLHTSVDQGIADINQPSPIRAHLHILEAVRVRWPYPNGQRVCAGPETDLTYPNLIKRFNTVLAGVDPVLIDAYGCIHFFDSKPEELTYVLRAFESGVGQMDVEAATREGRLRVFTSGQPAPTAVPPVQPTRATVETVAIPTPPGPPPTSTPLPTATGLQAGFTSGPASQAPGAVASACQDQAGVISPNPLLNGALIPAAAVVLGVGLVVAKRLARGEKGEGDGSSPT